MWFVFIPFTRKNDFQVYIREHSQPYRHTKGMARIAPSPHAATESRLVVNLRTIQRGSMWGKVIGCMFLPFLCTGLACCIPAFAVDEIARPLKEIIAFYTPSVLNNIRLRVDREQKIFIDACNKVTDKCKGNDVVSSLRLIDIIRLGDATIGAIVRQPIMASLGIMVNMNKEGRTRYIAEVYNEYRHSGGNPSVVIYGLPEYCAVIMDPTSITMKQIYADVMGPTQLNSLVLLHKSKAGF